MPIQHFSHGCSIPAAEGKFQNVVKAAQKIGLTHRVPLSLERVDRIIA